MGNVVGRRVRSGSGIEDPRLGFEELADAVCRLARRIEGRSGSGSPTEEIFVDDRFSVLLDVDPIHVLSEREEVGRRGGLRLEVHLPRTVHRPPVVREFCGLLDGGEAFFIGEREVDVGSVRLDARSVVRDESRVRGRDGIDDRLDDVRRIVVFVERV